MSLAQSKLNEQPVLAVETSPSKFDHINASLIASLVLAGFLFVVLGLIWFSTFGDFSYRSAGPGVVIGPKEKDKKEKDQKPTDDTTEPGGGEFPEVEKIEINKTVAAVSEAVSSVQAVDRKRAGFGKGRGNSEGIGIGDGDNRIAPWSVDPLPEHKRWKISYQADGFDSYSSMLRQLKIDLGVVHETKHSIIRIEEPGTKNNITYSTRQEQNQQDALFFMHEKQRMKLWDVRLADLADVSTENCFTVQFYTDHSRKLVREAELAALKGTGKDIEDVRRTFLKVVPNGNGYKFEVTRIEYR